MRAVKHLTTTAKAPTKEGVFDGVITYNPPEGDSDGERVENFTNTPTTVPLDFQHLIVMDPGSVIGQIKALEVGDGKTLAVHGQLSIGNKMADAVFERMELPSEDPMVLKELSVAYAYDPSLNTKDANGVVVIHDAELLAISVVHAGAQPTRVMNVKSELDVLEKTALAGLITVEQAMKYAEDLGIPGDISQKLFESSATVDVKYMGDAEPPAGSYEERQEDIEEAVEAYAGAGSYIYLIATFADRVVACICTDMDETYMQFPYAYDGETVTLGTPTEVEIEMSIVDAAKAANLGNLHQHLTEAPPRGHGMTEEEAASVSPNEHAALQAEHRHPLAYDPAAKALGQKWDGSAAMHTCSSAADFRKIAFERANDSDPDTAAHWALPHHSSPGAAADKTGVSAALAALNGARGGAPDLKDSSAAKSHLEAHERSFGNSGKAEEAEVAQTDEAHIVINEKEMTVDEAREFLELPPLAEGEQAVVEAEKSGRVIGAKRVTDLKSAIASAIDEFAASVNGDLAEKDLQVGDLIDGEKADEVKALTSQLDELVADQVVAEEAEARVAEIEAEVAEKEEEQRRAREEEIADFRLRLEALSQ